ncbi:MAG: serine/threonine protein kinase [Lentisphaeria bacterium]|jgi:Ser/Thr protein kinase RdoA (MazF antagonist)|nr:serine/threonine protein kinase [Lentisphaeria bacterium]
MDKDTGPHDFEKLTPDLILTAVEQALDVELTGLTSPLNSYINRVFELEATDGTRLIVKFYRPNRWTDDAIVDEHMFILDCEEAEIPVIAPLDLNDSYTVGDAEGIVFAIYPKRHGRMFEFVEDEDWRRLGRLLGRVHRCGSEYDAEHRVILHPARSTAGHIDTLLDAGFVAPHLEEAFADITSELMELIEPLFDDAEYIRIHGDCHTANVLHPDDGIMLIDFDDMAMGPPVQDLWMLLPDHAWAARHEVNLVLEGYEDFRPFDHQSLRLIEPLRAMRILYFNAWRSRQVGDPRFEESFPEWGNDNFWQSELNVLQRQLSLIRERCL